MSPSSVRLLVFAAAELLLVLAIPFLVIEGYHTLLGSRSGTFVAEPSRHDPGWSAAVAPTAVVGVAEMFEGTVTGLALIVAAGPGAGSAADSGTVVVVPVDAVTGLVDGGEQASVGPERALDTLASTLRLSLTSTVVVDEDSWSAVLGTTAYQIDNPDPVPGDGGEPAFAVGSVTVDGSNAGIFAGRPVEDGPLSSLTARRRLLWNAVVDTPPDGDHPLNQVLAQAFPVAGGRAVDIPVVTDADGLRLDAAAAEDLVRTVVAFPAGERLKMRIVDRTGAVDLETVAAAVAGRGIEVVEIANATRFDSGSTELIVPADLTVGRSQLDRLADQWGLEPVVDNDATTPEVTLLVGTDYRPPTETTD